MKRPLWLALAGCAAMVVAMLAGPALAPPEFDWIRHTTSQQAGQHVAGAWIMRLGFVGYGLGTLLAALDDRHRRPLVRAALGLFGMGLIATAVWSHAAIGPDPRSDPAEDMWHSVASFAVGIGFAAACALRLSGPGGRRGDVLAWAGLVISVAIPLAMQALPAFAGLLQRAMFVFSMVLVAQEFGAARAP